MPNYGCKNNGKNCAALRVTNGNDGFFEEDCGRSSMEAQRSDCPDSEIPLVILISQGTSPCLRFVTSWCKCHGW